MRMFDLVVIGSGAGLLVLEEGLKRGLSCALIERDNIGGTCLNRGCIPSKVLIEPADLIREAERAARRYGSASKRTALTAVPMPVPAGRSRERPWEKTWSGEAVRPPGAGFRVFSARRCSPTPRLYVREAGGCTCRSCSRCGSLRARRC